MNSIQNYNVMVIEDEELLLQAIKKKLELAGFTVVTCTHGLQALDYLDHLEKMPDLIWLDYYLQDQSGLEFMATLRSKSNTHSIPVVVVSNSADPQKVHRMLALGASKYLLKAEHRLEEIIQVIRGFVQAEIANKQEQELKEST